MYLITDTLTLIELLVGLLAAFALAACTYNLWESALDVRAAFRTLSLTAERTRIVAVSGLLLALILESQALLWLLIAVLSGSTATLREDVPIAATLTTLQGLFIALVLQQALVALTLVVMRYSLYRTWARVRTQESQAVELQAELQAEGQEHRERQDEKQDARQGRQDARQGSQDARQGSQDARQGSQDERQRQQEGAPQ